MLAAQVLEHVRDRPVVQTTLIGYSPENCASFRSGCRVLGSRISLATGEAAQEYRQANRIIKVT